MMLDPKTADELLRQLDSQKRLLTSPEWLEFVRFLKKERKPYLQSKVNSWVKEGNIVQAQIALALMDDVDKEIELFRKYVSETESKVKQGGS